MIRNSVLQLNVKASCVIAANFGKINHILQWSTVRKVKIFVVILPGHMITIIIQVYTIRVMSHNESIDKLNYNNERNSFSFIVESE